MPDESTSNFFQELKRRRVFGVVALYIVGAFVALQVADLAFPGLGIDGSAIRYVWIGAILGLPIALFFGWRYDVIDWRIVRTPASDADADLSIRRLDYIILAALSLVVVVIAIGLIGEISNTRTGETTRFSVTDIDPKSVAVLPFINIGGDPDNEYFSDGLTEALLHALAQLPELKVPARTSSFFFKGQDVDVREIAAQLGVSKVLEGSIQRTGDSLRITAQLIEAETGYHLWSRKYDRRMDNLFEIQDDIANNVALKMQVTLAGNSAQGGSKIETVSTDDIEAYEDYLHGLEQKNIASNASLLDAEISFRAALARDPGFYEARLELGRTHRMQAHVGEIGFAEAINRLEPLVERLLAERPDDGLVLTLAGWLEYYQSAVRDNVSFNLDKHLDGISAAVARTPNIPELYEAMYRLLEFSGNSEEAIEWLDKGIAVDPLDWQLHMLRAHHVRAAGDIDAAEESFNNVIELNPEFPSVYSYLSGIERQRGREGKAFELARKAMLLGPLDHEYPLIIAADMYRCAQIDEGDRYLQRAMDIASDRPRTVRMRIEQALLKGDHEIAIEISEKALRDNIQNRRGAYWYAVTTLTSLLLEAGKANEALALFEEIRPGITAPEFIVRNYKNFAIQYHAVLILAQSQSSDETLAMLDVVERNWDTNISYWRDDAGDLALIALARGERQEAIALALKNLERGAIRHYQENVFFKELAKEPPVAARIAELEAEIEKSCERLLTYVDEHDLRQK